MKANKTPNSKWPKAGDKAFLATFPPISPSTLVAFIKASGAGCRLGFRLAADAVIDSARREGAHPDIFFRPVAFLYRHYLELMLKDLVQIGRAAGALVIPDRQLIQHDLAKLWNSTKILIEQVWPGSPIDELAAVERVLLEFHQFDASGQEFRYAYDVCGKASLSVAPDWINLDNLQATMHGVAKFLEAVEAGLDAGHPGVQRRTENAKITLHLLKRGRKANQSPVHPTALGLHDRQQHQDD